MSTEALSIDQAVDKLVGEEPAQDTSDIESVVDDVLIQDEPEEDVNSTEEDSDVDNSEEYSEEYDTDDESTEYENEPVQTWTDETVVPIKVDGEDGTATIRELKQAFAGQGKIQRGMQEAAEARKQAEGMKQQAEMAMRQLTAMYEQVQANGFKAPPQEPSRELFNSDPIGYMEAKMQYDADMKEFTTQQQQMQQMQQAQQQQLTIAQQRHIDEQARLLAERLPEMADPEKGEKLRTDLARTAIEFGYTEQELSGISDHRALLVLRDAMRWRNSQKSREQVERKAQKARPVVKPQAKKSVAPSVKQARQQKAQLKKTGSIDDALNFILS